MIKRLGTTISGRGTDFQRFPRFAPFTLGVSADFSGARIYQGRFLHAVTVIRFQKKFFDGEDFNVLSGQDEIPGLTAEVPDVFGASGESGAGDEEKSRWADLNFFGDVYLQWTVDQEDGSISDVSITGPDEPNGTPITELDSGLEREPESWGSGGAIGQYHVKIGTVDEDGTITQEINSDVTYCTTLIPENPSSEPESSSESSESESSSSSESSESASNSSSGSSSGSSSTGSSGASSGGSSGESSEPNPSGETSSSGSSSESGESGESGTPGSSEDPSTPGGGSSEGSGSGDGGGGSGSDKSSAIVPLDLSPTGYTALLTMEGPEVWFFDIPRAKILGPRTEYKIDPWFVRVCEPGSLRVIGPVCNKPAMIGACVEDGMAILDIQTLSGDLPETVDFMLCGTRRGFKGMRFPLRDKEQFDANERHLNSAYPAKNFKHLKKRK